MQPDINIWLRFGYCHSEDKDAQPATPPAGDDSDQYISAVAAVRVGLEPRYWHHRRGRQCSKPETVAVS